MITGFPNLFTITGAGSPVDLGNMIPLIEENVKWGLSNVLNISINIISIV
jgi:hypothetical protein